MREGIFMNFTTLRAKAPIFILSLPLVLFSTLAYAGQVIGTIIEVEGVLNVKKENGAIKNLSKNSEVEEGDTLISDKTTYAKIKFVDDSEITLKPSSQLKISLFTYEVDKPEKDNSVLSLIKGGLRSITGMIGKRNKDRVKLNTPSATIGIRGTTYIAEYILPSNAGEGAIALSPGLYVQVLNGMVNLTNQGGSQAYSAGQFGYSPNYRQAPIVLPNNPGIKFTPPPSFSTTDSKTNNKATTTSSTSTSETSTSNSDSSNNSSNNTSTSETTSNTSSSGASGNTSSSSSTSNTSNNSNTGTTFGGSNNGTSTPQNNTNTPPITPPPAGAEEDPECI